jgi:DNA repair exonuclease SbcCD nuclease subunit
MILVDYSDVHFANYSSGVSLQDVVAVDQAVTACAQEVGADAIIFGGDRFLSHTPTDDVRLEADRCQRDRNDLGIVTFSLVGNHDWWGKSSVTGHSNRFAQELWSQRHENLVVMDAPITYRHPKLPKLAVHALPAGTHISEAQFELLPNGHNVLVFHDLLMGAVIDVQTQYRAPKGLNIADLDDERFDCVLGGDVHIPQKLPFVKTRGGYCGSPIQQSRRDRGGDTGWLVVEIESDFSKPVQARKFQSTFVSSPCPRFVDATFDHLPTAQELEVEVNIHYGESCKGNIVDVFITGPQTMLDQISPEYSERLRIDLGAKRVKLVLKLIQNNTAIITTQLQQTSLIADYASFLATQQLAGLSETSLIEKIQNAIRGAGLS